MLSYSISVDPSPPPEDASAISIDPSAQTLTVYSENLAVAGVYTVSVITLTPTGAESDISFSFKLTVIDPCLEAQLTIDPSILQRDEIDYYIGDEAHVESFAHEKVSSTEAIANCPNVVFAIENQDSTSYDASVFSFEDLQTFKVYSENESLIG